MAKKSRRCCRYMSVRHGFIIFTSLKRSGSTLEMSLECGVSSGESIDHKKPYGFSGLVTRVVRTKASQIRHFAM
eukprot:3289772-Prymnesium_polylepis.2